MQVRVGGHTAPQSQSVEALAISNGHHGVELKTTRFYTRRSMYLYYDIASPPFSTVFMSRTNRDFKPSNVPG